MPFHWFLKKKKIRVPVLFTADRIFIFLRKCFKNQQNIDLLKASLVTLVLWLFSSLTLVLCLVYFNSFLRLVKGLTNLYRILFWDSPYITFFLESLLSSCNSPINRSFIKRPFITKSIHVGESDLKHVGCLIRLSEEEPFMKCLD